MAMLVSLLVSIAVFVTLWLYCNIIAFDVLYIRTCLRHTAATPDWKAAIYTLIGSVLAILYNLHTVLPVPPLTTDLIPVIVLQVFYITIGVTVLGYTKVRSNTTHLLVRIPPARRVLESRNPVEC